MKPNTNLKEIAQVFLKMGSIAFGGPAAHIAMMEDEIVTKRKWISLQHFLDLIGATNIIPGPNSTEMTMHCGYERGGWKGMLVAGFSFILPAVTITMLFAFFYTSYGHLPEVKPFLYGIKPAVIAIIISAGYKLGKKALKNIELGILGVVTFIICILGTSEILALLVCGVIGILVYLIKSPKKTLFSISPVFLILANKVTSIGELKIFLVFLKVGAILYGSGYVLFAFLDDELVTSGLLSRNELMDAIAVGQFTPGPVLSTATFIGWQLGGFWGAILATVGIFLPSFIFVSILNPIVPKLRKSKLLSSFLDAVNVGAVAIIFAVCYTMGRESLYDWRTVLIALLSLMLVFVFKKMNSANIVIGGSLLGYIFSLV